METKIKILIVETEMISGAKISMQLTDLGYEVTGILSRGEDALLYAEENRPDIVILDIHLKGNMDGIETAARLQQMEHVSIIFLTANSDETTINRAKLTRPHAFISKPFRQLDLQRAIELAVSHIGRYSLEDVPSNIMEDGFHVILNDRIFVRHKDRMVKVLLADILYVEADRNYCRIHTRNKEYVLSITLKVMEEKVPSRLFIRIHRSYIVNIAQVDEVMEDDVIVAGKTIPLGAGMREMLMKSLQTL
jgi:DNA-binding LytR/AlgR family response regulator